MTHHTVEIVIPHRSRWDQLKALLESLEVQTYPAAVCVVDNNSSDDSLEQLSHTEARTIALDENLGFGRAVNRGVFSSKADIVLLLNNDMVVEPNYVESMVHELTLSPEEVAVNAIQLRPDGKVDSLGVGVDQSLCAFDLGHGLDREQFTSEQMTALAPSGGSAGLFRSSFIRVGGYDENIFAYLEDVDLGIRLINAGVGFRLASGAIVWHRHSSTLGVGSRKKNEMMGWSRGYILWKYHNNLGIRARIRGVLVDAVTYLGQIVIDRNIGSIVGRLNATRHLGSPPPPSKDFPVNRISMFEALTRKRKRR